MSDQDESKQGPPTIGIGDAETGMLKARVLPSKGVTDEGINAITSFIDLLGYKKCVIKADTEAAIKPLRQEAIRHTPCEVVKEQPPEYDSQSNGRIENIAQRIQGMFRTLKDALESKLGGRVREGSRIIPWLVKHAASTKCIFTTLSTAIKPVKFRCCC